MSTSVGQVGGVSLSFEKRVWKTMTATRTSLNKGFNEKNNGRARAL